MQSAKRDEVGAPRACGGESANQMWETIPEMVLSAANRFGDAEAIVDGPLRYTFRDVVDRIRCAAGAFADLGNEKGERVAIWAQNSADWVIACLGLQAAGGVLVPLNTRFKAEEARYILTRSPRTDIVTLRIEPRVQKTA